MSEKKIIAVVGATGAQGGGLARAILDHPDSAFTVRALTREPSSAAAQALATRGAEVVALTSMTSNHSFAPSRVRTAPSS